MVTLADLVRATGAKPRSVQLWADAGVLIPETGTDREGSGRHRQFSKLEAVIACVIARFAADKVAIGALKGIAHSLRQNQFLAGEEWALKEAMEGRGRSFLQVTSFPHEPTGKTAYMVHMINSSRSSIQLIKFLEERASGAANMHVIDLDYTLRILRSMAL